MLLLAVLLLGFAAITSLAAKLSAGAAQTFSGALAHLMQTEADAPSAIQIKCGNWTNELNGTAKTSEQLVSEADRCALEAAALAEANAPPTRGTGNARTPAKKVASTPNDPVEARIRAALRPVELLIRVPPQLEAGVASEIDAIIKTADDQNLAISALAAQRALSREEIQVTSDVQVVLHGSGMEVSASDEGWRTLTSRSPSIWKWKMTASGEGEKQLTFSVRGKVRIGEEDKYFDAFIATRSVMVVMSPLQRALLAAESAQKFVDIFQSLWLVLSGAFAAAAAFALRQMRRIRRNGQPDPVES